MLSARVFVGALCLWCECVVGAHAADGKRLYFFAPSAVIEGTNTLAELGRVFLSEPATTDVVVKLRADPLLQTPSTVTIPAGRSSQTFTISVGDDALYGLDYPATITALAEG